MSDSQQFWDGLVARPKAPTKGGTYGAALTPKAGDKPVKDSRSGLHKHNGSNITTSGGGNRTSGRFDPSIPDLERAKFMEKMVIARKVLRFDEWEEKFITSYASFNQYHRWMSDGRREWVDKLWMKYGSDREIGIPFPGARATAKIPQADPGCCDFCVREPGIPLRSCNDPAEFIGKTGIRYCRQHADHVREDYRKRGVAIELRPYQAKV